MPTKTRRAPTDLQLAAMQVEIWSRDPWRFILECCYTQDEADGGKIKRFPQKDYLEYVCGCWLRYPLLAIPKSRRMIMTWLMLALDLWQALFRPRSAIFVQSKKEEDSIFLLSEKRLGLIYDRLPKMYGWPKLEAAKKQLKFSNGSYIMPIGQGADQLRQYTATLVHIEEMAFWDWPEDTWTALKPTIQGGGRVAMVSTAGPGFFQRIVEGEIA